MKKNLVLMLGLSMFFSMGGWNSSNKVNKSILTNNSQKSVYENVTSQKVAKVKSKVKLYCGNYFDSKTFGDTVLKKYCEVQISDITKTSFDFAVYEVKFTNGKEHRSLIFNKNTAVFTDNGKKAAFYGKKYTLKFKFPNYHRAYPIVTDMQISGFKLLQGKTFVNNSIPGHEFS